VAARGAELAGGDAAGGRPVVFLFCVV
jgi:hypothetical protein